jgi:hypothetical protein
MTSSNIPDEAGPARAVRLIFEYDGDDVRLLSQQPVDVAVTGFDIASETRPGNYVETRSGAGDALVRVAARGAFVSSAEVFPEEPGRPITRVNLDRPRGAFTVVVPATSAAQQVAVVRVAPRPPAGGGAAISAEPDVVDLATFPLEVR